MKKTILSLILPAILLTPLFVANAQVPAEIVTVFNKVVTALFWVLGAAAVVSFIIAGIYFITSQGDPEKVKTARQWLIYGIVGVVVGLLAYVILRFAESMTNRATGV